MAPLKNTFKMVGSSWWPWVEEGPGAYQAHGSIGCPPGSTLVFSGGWCDGTSDSAIFSSQPGATACRSASG